MHNPTCHAEHVRARCGACAHLVTHPDGGALHAQPRSCQQHPESLRWDNWFLLVSAKPSPASWRGQLRVMSPGQCLGMGFDEESQSEMFLGVAQGSRKTSAAHARLKGAGALLHPKATES